MEEVSDLKVIASAFTNCITEWTWSRKGRKEISKAKKAPLAPYIWQSSKSTATSPSTDDGVQGEVTRDFSRAPYERVEWWQPLHQASFFTQDGWPARIGISSGTSFQLWETGGRVTWQVSSETLIGLKKACSLGLGCKGWFGLFEDG